MICSLAAYVSIPRMRDRETWIEGEDTALWTLTVVHIDYHSIQDSNVDAHTTILALFQSTNEGNTGRIPA